MGITWKKASGCWDACSSVFSVVAATCTWHSARQTARSKQLTQKSSVAAQLQRAQACNAEDVSGTASLTSGVPRKTSLRGCLLSSASAAVTRVLTRCSAC